MKNDKIIVRGDYAWKGLFFEAKTEACSQRRIKTISQCFDRHKSPASLL